MLEIQKLGDDTTNIYDVDVNWSYNSNWPLIASPVMQTDYKRNDTIQQTHNLFTQHHKPDRIFLPRRIEHSDQTTTS